MDKKKLEKGMYGFHAQKKKSEIIKTIVLFGIALAVYFTGLLHTGTNKNLLTVVAIVGMLPASKSAVSMLMFVRYKAAAASLHEQLEKCGNSMEACGVRLYDLIFVLNEKVVKTDCVFVLDTAVTVYTANTQMPENELSKYLKNFLSNHGKGNCTVKTYKTEKAFLEHIKSRIPKEQDEKAVENQTKIKDMLLGFSM